MPAPVTQYDTCAHCLKNPPNLQRCSRCKLTCYCNSACQKVAWQSHKSICKKPPPDLPTSPPKTPVPGVRLLGGYNRPFHPNDTPVSPSHTVWTTGTISPVSQIVGLPLLIHREVQELSLDEPNDENKDNQAVTYLMIDLESGFAPPRWQKNIGPVTIVRADQKPLTRVALEMIWMYCDAILEDFGDDPLHARRRYSPEAFQSYCKRYRDEKIQNKIREDEFVAQSLPL